MGRFTPLLVIIGISGLIGNVLGQATGLSILSKTACTPKDVVTQAKPVCETDEMIWVHQSYFAKTRDLSNPDFCANPKTEYNDHCIQQEEWMTDETGRQCATFTTCSVTVNEPWDFKEECPGYDGYVYLHIEYKCLPRNIYFPGDKTIIIDHMNMYVDQTQTFTHKVYMMSSSYSQWTTESPNICQVVTAANTSVTAQIFDLRGRLINAANACPFQLEFMQLEKNNLTLFSECGYMKWTYKTVQATATLEEPMLLNITFKKRHFRGEGRVWLQLEATDVEGRPTAMSITCTSPRERLTSTPKPTTTTTTTTARPFTGAPTAPTTTKSTTTKTTTTTTTTTTTPVPTTTTTTTPIPTTTTPFPTTTTTTPSPTTTPKKTTTTSATTADPSTLVDKSTQDPLLSSTSSGGGSTTVVGGSGTGTVTGPGGSGTGTGGSGTGTGGSGTETGGSGTGNDGSGTGSGGSGTGSGTGSGGSGIGNSGSGTGGSGTGTGGSGTGTGGSGTGTGGSGTGTGGSGTGSGGAGTGSGTGTDGSGTGPGGAGSDGGDTPTFSPENSDDGLNMVPIIAGACAGGVFLIVMLIICIICCAQCRKNKKNEAKAAQSRSFDHINAWEADGQDKKYKDMLGGSSFSRNEGMHEAQYTVMPSNQIIKDDGVYREVSREPSMVSNGTVTPLSGGYSTMGRDRPPVSPQYNQNQYPAGYKTAPATKPKPRVSRGSYSSQSSVSRVPVGYTPSPNMDPGYATTHKIPARQYDNGSVHSGYSTTGGRVNHAYNHDSQRGSSHDSGFSSHSMGRSHRQGSVAAVYGNIPDNNNAYSSNTMQSNYSTTHKPSLDSYVPAQRSATPSDGGFDAPDNTTAYQGTGSRIGTPTGMADFENTTVNPLLTMGFNDKDCDVFY